MSINEKGQFDTYTLTLEMVWYIRENSTRLPVIRIKNLVEEIEHLDSILEHKRKQLEILEKRLASRIAESNNGKGKNGDR